MVETKQEASWTGVSWKEWEVHLRQCLLELSLLGGPNVCADAGTCKGREDVQTRSS